MDELDPQHVGEWNAYRDELEGAVSAAPAHMYQAIAMWVAIGVVTLVAAGWILYEQAVGAAALSGGCSGGLLIGWAALIIAGGAFGAVLAEVSVSTISALALRARGGEGQQRPAGHTEVRLRGALIGAATPLVVSLVALPAFIGCGFGRSVAGWPIVGVLLSGSTGVAVTAAAATTAGVLFGCVARLWWGVRQFDELQHLQSEWQEEVQ